MIPWQGGKRRLVKHLLPLFPEHQCYVELFAGGAALFFMKERAAKCEVLNDINGELVNLYRVVQNHFDEFVRQFDWVLAARDTFALHQHTPPSSLTDIQRAARFFFLQHNCFGGKSESQSFGTATTARAWPAAEVRDKLKNAQERLSGVYIEHEPWQKCLRRYDRPHTFFYADPPYWDTTGYGVDFEWSEYEQLAEHMRTIQGKLMLSINDHPDIRALFKEFRIVEFDLAYSISRDTQSRVKRGELVVCNW